jgi:hypothetical protein
MEQCFSVFTNGVLTNGDSDDDIAAVANNVCILQGAFLQPFSFKM